jgi:hypothetical protein
MSGIFPAIPNINDVLALAAPARPVARTWLRVTPANAQEHGGEVVVLRPGIGAPARRSRPRRGRR